ncbi:hypothetical protein V6N11_000685 [Hibiscus sabdariffa]|uniref:Uncharacterized protein n=1 Tax=Hibiscus sabdariffa TaxID=183260 RepID=A0ABR2RYB1_9ROSI
MFPLSRRIRRMRWGRLTVTRGLRRVGADSKSVDEAAVKDIGTMVAWRENELWKGLKGVSCSSVLGCEVSPIEPAPVVLNAESTSNWVSVPITDGVELLNGSAAEGSTTEILFRNGNK